MLFGESFSQGRPEHDESAEFATSLQRATQQKFVIPADAGTLPNQQEGPPRLTNGNPVNPRETDFSQIPCPHRALKSTAEGGLPFLDLPRTALRGGGSPRDASAAWIFWVPASAGKTDLPCPNPHLLLSRNAPPRGRGILAESNCICVDWPPPSQGRRSILRFSE